ncbi:Sentrin-specific protease 8 [Lamellibrachia satsuma]|nr:Sentrin-specific protease 8 [Lamellibrachia satsuma]
MGEKDAVVLNFNDSLLRQSDIELLDGNRWLNDKLIGFAFRQTEVTDVSYDIGHVTQTGAGLVYYEKVQFQSISENVVYINPDVSHFIKLGSDDEDELGLFLEPLELHSKQRIFLAVNDNTELDSAGGSHWSLLMFDRKDNTFHSYDSFHSSNVTAARTVANKTAPYLKASAHNVGFVEEKSAQQTNGCDCGVYVICYTEALSRQFAAGDSTPFCSGVTETTVSQKRLDLKDLILRLATDQDGSSDQGHS